jgi:hypothetical protein
MRRPAEEIEHSRSARCFTGRDDILLALVRGLHGYGTPWPPQQHAESTPGAVQALGRPRRLYDTRGMPTSPRHGRPRPVPADAAWAEPRTHHRHLGRAQAVGDVLIGLLAAAATPTRTGRAKLWATALDWSDSVVGRRGRPAGLHALYDDALTDCLTRALAGPTQLGPAPTA